jgi:LacI family transcriptional regulator
MKITAPTIREVAAIARVATATVSSYFGDGQGLPHKVDAAPDAAIASLGDTSNRSPDRGSRTVPTPSACPFWT